MKFTKMEGLGNDYIYVDGAREVIPYDKKPEIVRRLSDRHFGIGGDGVIFINPNPRGDFEMEMWNADGTRSEMCGNGMRCVGKYVHDMGLTDKTELAIESGGKMKYLTLTLKDGQVESVCVDMGEAGLAPEVIPADLGKANPEGAAQATVTPVEGIGVQTTEGQPANASQVAVISQPITVDGKMYEMTLVNMGNPHAVVFYDGIDDMDIEAIGPKFENHSCFPQRTNTEFIEVIDRTHVKMRVWERGTGETLACGTGACAVGVACMLNEKTEDHVTVSLLGGDLDIRWDRAKNRVYKTGPAKFVFQGEVELPELNA